MTASDLNLCEGDPSDCPTIVKLRAENAALWKACEAARDYMESVQVRCAFGVPYHHRRDRHECGCNTHIHYDRLRAALALGRGGAP